jgi:hypothetical protein
MKRIAAARTPKPSASLAKSDLSTSSCATNGRRQGNRSSPRSSSRNAPPGPDRLFRYSAAPTHCASCQNIEPIIPQHFQSNAALRCSHPSSLSRSGVMKCYREGLLSAGPAANVTIPTLSKPTCSPSLTVVLVSCGFMLPGCNTSRRSNEVHPCAMIGVLMDQRETMICP